MASSDARPFPLKNTAFRAVFPIFDKTGALVTGAAGLDSEVSKDQGTFADCTNEATEIATSSGIYYLDLTSTEMNADNVTVIVKTSTTDARTTVLSLYPVEDGDIRVNVVQFGGSAGAFSGGRPEVNASHAAGTAWNSGAIGANTLASDTITAAKIAADAIGASELASDAAQEIADALLDRTAGVETSWTVRQALRIMLAVLAGKASGLGTTTAVFRDMADSKDRISATVDISGNRSAVTRDAS